MAGVRAQPLKRLLSLLGDAGAAHYRLDEENRPYFVLYTPLLGGLIQEETSKVVTDLRRTSRPFLGCDARESGPLLCFNEIVSTSRFETALLDVLGGLCSYERVVCDSEPGSVGHSPFPTLSLSEIDEDPIGELVRRTCLTEVSYVANRVRKLSRPLDTSERLNYYSKVLPEYEPLIREAEELALRIVRLQSVLKGRVSTPTERQQVESRSKMRRRDERAVRVLYRPTRLFSRDSAVP